MSESAPKIFISYSWTNETHEEWVINLATELRENGIDVILDKWDLKEGHDANAFMEKMVSDPKINKVILVCDKEYALKADSREGGVGTEAQIITPELYKKKDQDKYVAVVKERDEDGNAYLPTFFKSRVYIDLSEENLYSSNFDQLLRWIFDKPLHVKPNIGKRPAFLDEDSHLDFGVSSKLRRAKNSITEGKSNWSGALQDVYDTIVSNFEVLRIDPSENEIDELVLKSIEDFLPIRNELIQLFLILGQYKKNENEAFTLTHRFFERLLPFTERPERMQSYREWDFDNFRFIIHELFLYANACFLFQQAFNFANYLLSNQYYYQNINYGKSDLLKYPIFRRYLKSLEEYRKRRIDTNRISIHSDLLKSRSEGSGISFNKLMETDFIMYLRSCRGDRYWYPITNLYAAETFYTSFELFTRAQSTKFFNEIKPLLNVSDKEELKEVIDSILAEKYRRPRWDYRSLDVEILTGIDKIATAP
ncbi:MAG: TIR domain-containing protein [Balneolaceae bacterium]|nr:TIR domain-containing protein [Balneolaceae bacterium]MCH8535959.1 TIR domain-containing protein [Flavobacteriaceae bacterium]